jgi:hypothetical protein
MVDRQRDDQARSQIPRKPGQDRFRVSGFGCRRLRAQVNMNSVAEVRHLGSATNHAASWWRSHG